MLTDLISVPGAGGIAAAGILYAGFSLLVAGPLVGERMIERSGWAATCERGLTSSTSQKLAQGTIGGECQILLGPFFGKEGVQFCQRNSRDLESWSDLAKRFAQAPRAPASQSICACAVREVLENRRSEFALHAGSMRLISPRPLRNLKDELSGASVACQRRSS